MVKKDLAEFSSVMQEDTIKAASKVKEKLTVSSVLIILQLVVDFSKGSRGMLNTSMLQFSLSKKLHLKEIL